MSLQIAAVGWDHEHWHKDYYPHDLPADWRLTYYANEFRAVLVSELTRSSQPTQDPEQWYQDTPDAFRFYILMTATLLRRPDWPAVTRCLNPLKEKLGGVVMDGRSDTFDRAALTLGAMHPEAHIFEETGGIAKSGLRQWRSAQGRTVAWYKCAPQYDLKILRMDLERIVESSGGDECVIFIEGNIKVLQDATVIVRLLGY
jgi:hypothetical protein